eukprot:scaffold6581_cov57-Attheya_sp.AAC.14
MFTHTTCELTKIRFNSGLELCKANQSNAMNDTLERVVNGNVQVSVSRAAGDDDDDDDDEESSFHFNS